MNSFLNSWPVIHRELRVESRRPFNYWLRIAPLFFVLAIVSLNFGEASSGDGIFIFRQAHVWLIVATWIVVPLLTADCISREVRDGTLGLLLLTPLSPTGIVVGKSLLQGTRALCFLLAGAPLLGICLLLGGIGAVQIGASILLQCSMLFLALAAGLLASVHNERWIRALVWSFFINVVFVALYSWSLWLVDAVVDPDHARWMNPFEVAWEITFYIVLGYEAWEWIVSGTGTGLSDPKLFLWMLLGQCVGCATVLLIVINHCAHRIPLLRAGAVQHGQLGKVGAVLYKPILFQAILARTTRQILDRNPVIWLQQHIPQARLGKWILCLLVLALQTAIVVFDDPSAILSSESQIMVFTFLGCAMAFIAAGSFRGERESGVFELLLVSPLSEKRILAGRLFGIYWMFIPAIVMVTFSWYMASLLDIYWRMRVLNSMLFWAAAASYLQLPLFGLNASLRLRHFLSAFGLTCFFGLLNFLWQCVLFKCLMAERVWGFVFHGDPLSLSDSSIRYVLIVSLIILGFNWWFTRRLWTLLNYGLTRRTFAAVLT